VVADLAWLHMSPTAQQAAMQALSPLNPFYPSLSSFHASSIWLDVINSTMMPAFQPWHYSLSALPASSPGMSQPPPPAPPVPTPSSLGAVLSSALAALQGNHIDVFGRAFVLRVLLNLLADLHQVTWHCIRTTWHCLSSAPGLHLLSTSPLLCPSDPTFRERSSAALHYAYPLLSIMHIPHSPPCTSLTLHYAHPSLSTMHIPHSPLCTSLTLPYAHPSLSTMHIPHSPLCTSLTLHYAHSSLSTMHIPHSPLCTSLTLNLPTLSPPHAPRVQPLHCADRKHVGGGEAAGGGMEAREGLGVGSVGGGGWARLVAVEQYVVDEADTLFHFWEAAGGAFEEVAGAVRGDPARPAAAFHVDERDVRAAALALSAQFPLSAFTPREVQEVDLAAWAAGSGSITATVVYSGPLQTAAAASASSPGTARPILLTHDYNIHVQEVAKSQLALAAYRLAALLNASFPQPLSQDPDTYSPCISLQDAGKLGENKWSQDQ
ncbi:unnamed protein product, partial [Closterium sp. NIES-53]